MVCAGKPDRLVQDRQNAKRENSRRGWIGIYGVKLAVSVVWAAEGLLFGSGRSKKICDFCMSGSRSKFNGREPFLLFCIYIRLSL